MVFLQSQGFFCRPHRIISDTIAGHLPYAVPPPSELKLSTASAIATGTLLGTYEDKRFKSESKKLVLKSIDFLGLDARPELEKKLKYSQEICSGVILGKELVNAPANVLTPEVLAEEAVKIASAYSDVFTAKILDTEQCKELKMGPFLLLLLLLQILLNLSVYVINL